MVTKEGLCIIVSVIIVIVSSSQDTCEPLKIEMCSKYLNYTQVRLPNEIGHKTQEDAANEIRQTQKLIDTECSSDLRLFLCSLFAPICDPEGKGRKIVPCREMCLNVRDRCEPIMKENSFNWPNSWRCGRFPVFETTEGSTFCIKGEEERIQETDPPFKKTDPPIKPVTKPKTSPPETNDDDNILITEPNVCRTDQMFCDNTCIPISYRCDQFDDCKDKKDEQNCDKCLSNQFRCKDGKKCIPLNSRCDAFPDCDDESDEDDTCGVCTGTEFQCDKNRCIPNSLVCDKKRDCVDGADEQACEECGSHEFKCTNNRCVPLSSRCDKSDDCADNSDEDPAMCNYDIEPDNKSDHTNDGTDTQTDNNIEVADGETCTSAHIKCNADRECKMESQNFRRECEEQMIATTMTTCTKKCQNAYYQLRSKQPFGKLLIDKQCDQLYVKNVERSCIRKPPSFACNRAIDECRKTSECEIMYGRYSSKCQDVLNDHASCSDVCQLYYRTLVESPLSHNIRSNCIEVNKTMEIRCPHVNAINHSNSLSYSIHLLTVILVISALVAPR